MAQGAKLKDPQILRIFVSSPFSGMEGERDCLGKLYWPRLKSVLIPKGLLLRVVDLRWGITSEMSSDHETITTCLREIDRSDIFVGLYGQRYGWCGRGDEALQKNYDKALPRFPWVDQYRDRSITELEFLQGHLNDPKRTPSCFCFRDPAYDAKRSAQAKAEGNAKTEKNYKYENEEAVERLKDLRDRVAATEGDTMGITMDYKTPEEGAEFIYTCVRRYIDEVIFAHQAPLSKWEKSQQAHNNFMTSRGGIYIGGDKYAEKLNDFVSQEGRTPPLVITGATGCGKTALLSSWIQARKDAQENDIVIPHFVGADPKSSKPENLVQRITGNVGIHLTGKPPDIDFRVSIKPGELQNNLNESLLSMGKGKEKGMKEKLIIIVDRADELFQVKAFKPLYWLPNPLPENVRLILTVTTGSDIASETLDSLLNQHNAVEMDIGLLTDENKRILCDKILEQYSKSLETEQREMILNSPKTSQPFFLKILITELCTLGKFRTLSTQIEQLLECKNVAELLGTIIQRTESEYNHPDYGGNLVKDVLCAIYLCKRGISELEFPMPQYMWTPLIYAMEKYLINRSGLLSFSFPEMRIAIQNMYMSDRESRTEAAMKVAEIFYQPYTECLTTRRPIPKRIVIELPHLLQQAGDHERLLQVVSNIKVFEVLYESTPFVLNEYWQELGLPGDVISRRYMQSLDKYVASRYATHMKNMSEEGVVNLMTWKAKVLPQIREWMQTSRLYNGIEIVYDREIDLLSRIGGQNGLEQMKSISDVKFEKASFLANTGRYQEAQKLHQAVLSTGEKLVQATFIKRQEIARSYNALGRCCYKLKRLQEAEDWYMLAMETLKDDPAGRVHLAWVYYNLGLINYDQGDLKTSLQWYNKAVSLWEEIEPHRLSLGLAVNFLRIGSVYQKQDELDAAETYFNKALTVNKTLLGNDCIDVAKCLTNLSVLENEKKNHMKSLALVQQSVRIFKMMAPEGYHRTILAEEHMVRQLMQVDRHEEAESMIDNLVHQLKDMKTKSSKSKLYVDFIAKCIDMGNYPKAVDLTTQLLETPNESDTFISQLLHALSYLPDNKDTTHTYLTKLEYGLSQWPQSKDILSIHLAMLKKKDPSQVLTFIQKHCEGQPGVSAVGECYYTICGILEEALEDIDLARSALKLGLEYNSMDKPLCNLSERLQSIEA